MRPSRILNDSHKDNDLMNSKLQQSIKPFSTIREQALYSSKFNQSRTTSKPKKGISRVNSLQPVNKPKEQHKYSGKLSIVGVSDHASIHTLGQKKQPKTYDIQQKNQQIDTPLSLLHQKQLQKQSKTPNKNSSFQKLQIVREKTQQHEQNQNNNYSHHQTYINSQKSHAPNSQFLMSNKMKSLESQLTVFQHQIHQKNAQILQLKKLIKSQQQKIHNLERQNTYTQTNYDKQVLKSRQMLHKIQQYELMISRNQRKIKQLQVNPPISIQHKNQQQQAYMAQVQKQCAQAKQKYRQLLIKSSMNQQEKDNLTRKIPYYTQTITQLQNQKSQLTTVLKQMECHMQKLEQKAKLAESYYQDLQSLYYIKKKYQDSKYIIQTLQNRLKQYEEMRANQTTHHFQQLKRYQTKLQKQNEKDIHIIESLKKNIVQLQSTNTNLRIQLRQAYSQKQYRRDNYNENKQNELLLKQVYKLREQIDKKDKQQQNIRNDYQGIVSDMKITVRKLQTEVDTLHRQNLQYSHKLQNKSEQLRKYEQLMKNTAYRSNCSPQRSLKSFQFDLNSAAKQPNSANKNMASEISIKIEQYHSKIQNLQSKIHVCQLQNQKTKNKCQTYQRRIIHLEQQIKIYEQQKQKLLNQQIRNTEQLTSIKQQLKQTKSQQQKYQQKTAQLQQQLSATKIDNQCHMQKIQKYQSIMQQLQSQIKILEQRYEKIKNKNTQNLQKIQEICQQNRILRNNNGDLVDKRQLEQLVFKIQELSSQKNKLDQIYQVQIKNITKTNEMLIVKVSQLLQIDYQQNIEIFIQKCTTIINQFKDQSHKIKHLQIINKQLSQTVKAHLTSLDVHKNKCFQLQSKLARVQETHQQKLVLVKQDYDVVYAKYIKYRNMAVDGKNKNCHIKNH